MSEDRLVMLDDLIVSDVKDSLLDAIGVSSEACYKDSPDKCKVCGSIELEPLEVLGACLKPLFWECQDCDYKYLIYPRTKTEEFLTPAYGCWTTPSAWGRKDKSEFN